MGLINCEVQQAFGKNLAIMFSVITENFITECVYIIPMKISVVVQTLETGFSDLACGPNQSVVVSPTVFLKKYSLEFLSYTQKSDL